MHAGTRFRYQSFLPMLAAWDIPTRVAEKYSTWQLKHPLPKLSSHWLELIHHSLVYYLLKTLPWVFEDYRIQQVIEHSFAMKQSYTQIALKKGGNFDFNLVVLAKTVSYFVGSHFKEVEADSALENDIYQLTIHNILGIAVEPFAYPALIRRFRSAAAARKERESRDLDFMIDHSGHLQTKVNSLLSRRHAKKPTAANLLEIKEIQSSLQEVRAVLKEHLYVKANPRQPMAKYTISQLRALSEDSSQHARRKVNSESHAREGPQKGRHSILSNQLSHAFQYNSSLQLKQPKKFQIQRPPAKLQPMPRSFHPSRTHSQHLKLQIKRQAPPNGQGQARPDDEGQAQRNKGTKKINSWDHTVAQMKKELYTGKYKSNQNPRELHEFENQNLRLQVRDNANKRLKQQGEMLGNSKESFKFRKLDLMNSPNVVISEELGGVCREKELLPLAAANYCLFRLQLPAIDQLKVPKTSEWQIFQSASSLSQPNSEL